MRSKAAERLGITLEEEMKKTLRQIPMQRLGKPEGFAASAQAFTCVEAFQKALIQLSPDHAGLKRRGVNKELKDIADRCMARLYKKGTRLLFSGKEKNKGV